MAAWGMNRFPQRSQQSPKVLLPVVFTVFQGELLIVG
jgi:hypothetical protein